MKKISLLFISVFVFLNVFISLSFGANSQSSNDFFEYATVDTDPSTDGYGTNSIVIRKNATGKAWFSVRGTGTMTVTLQFKCNGDTAWTDYADYTTNVRKLIDGGGAGVKWRSIVKDTAYTSGSKSFGFDW